MRAPHQKKTAQPRKSMRGQAETIYGECKKTRCFSLTPTAYNSFKDMSKKLQISMSEVLEQVARSPGTLHLLQEDASGVERMF